MSATQAKLENRLARAEAERDRYRSLFDSLGQGYCELELVRDASGRAVDQRYIELNPAFERFFGVPAAQARGRTASEIFPGLEGLWTEAFDRVARTGQAERLEYPVASLNRWFEVFAYPAGGDRAYALYEDVTVRKRTELALRESEERQTFLLRLADTLRPLSDSSRIKAEAMRALGEHLHLSRAQYYEADDSGEYFEAGGGYADGVPASAGRGLMNQFGAHVKEAFNLGKTVAVADVARDPRVSPAELEAYDAIGLRAFVGIPLVKDGRWVGAIGLHHCAAHEWTKTEIALAEEVAERTWDAVERGRTEQALRESEARLAAAFESVPAGVAVIGLDGKVVIGNSDYLRFLPSGIIPSRDPAHKGLWQAWDAQGRPLAPQDFPGVRALRGERVVPGQEMVYRGEDGRERWTNVATTPTRDAAGNVTGCVSVISDVTESKAAEAALRESEERLRRFGEASQDVLWIRSIDTLQWTYLTPAFERIYGITREEALAGDNYRNWVGLIEPEDRAQADDAIRKVLAGEHVTFDYRIRRPSDGEVRWLRNTDFPIRDAAGRIVLIGGIGQDITRAREAEERQNILLAELQHRVRNILAVLRSIVSRSDDGERSTSDYVQHLQGRISALARTQALLTRSAGAGVDLEEMIRDELVVQAAQQSQFTLKGPAIELSPKAAEVLTLAVHELATNATKYGAFSRADGHLMVRWRGEAREGGNWLVLHWKEHGVPIVDAVPRRRGFGAELISRRIPYDLSGTGSFDLKPGGLESLIEFPLRPGDSILQTSGVSR
ncbi:Sensory box protein [Sphingomonas paucimobilis]|nr:Sensory box protein [Sphingomonas paucimobilis]